MPAFIYLSVDILLLMNLLEEHRRNGKKRPTTASCGADKNEGNSFHNLGVGSIATQLRLVHNHPSGDPEPSQADRTLTTTLKNALDMIGTRILDHVVVGCEGCVSLAERGYL